jgi:alanine racemase
MQFERFMQVRKRLNEAGLDPICHISNSAGTFLNEEYHLDMVRAGIVLYGLEPGGRENPYRPALTLKTLVSFVKDLPAGRDISYGRRYTTEKPCKVATLSVGYADGYPRALSGKGKVLIHGKEAPILGTVCMDQLMVDVTDIPCKAGDEVILMGGGIDIGALAQELGTIHYELVCGFSKRVNCIAK